MDPTKVANIRQQLLSFSAASPAETVPRSPSDDKVSTL